MNGMELFERVTREMPQLAERFVFMTGGATRADVEAFLASVSNEKLYKPFSLAHVKSLVSRFLEARKPPPHGEQASEQRYLNLRRA
jgi:hypothetical protein